MRAEAGASTASRDRAFYEERRRARARAAKRRRRLVAGAVTVLVLLVLGAGVGFAGSGDRIAQGVSIEGVDVGGMTSSEAEAALERRAAGADRQAVSFTAAGRAAFFMSGG